MKHLAAQLSQASAQVSHLFGLQSDLVEVTDLASRPEAGDITVLVSFTGGLRGNVILGFSEQESKQLVSAILGGMEVGGRDDMAQSVLGDFAIMLVGMALNGLRLNEVIHLSPPTLIMGKEVMLIMGPVRNRKMVCTFNAGSFTMILSLE